MSVIKENENMVFRGVSGVSPIEQMAQLIRVLGDGIVDADVNSLFVSIVAQGAPVEDHIKYDLGRLVQNFIQRVGENTKLVRLFNACSSQGIIAPAWLYLRLSVLQDFPFKDTKQSWVIYIVLKQTNIIVLHQRKEVSACTRPGTCDFEFTWEIKMTFDNNMEVLKSTQFGIVNFNVIAMSQKEQEHFKESIEPWIQKSFVKELPDL